MEISEKAILGGCMVTNITAEEEIETFASGAKRSKLSDRFDLICPAALRRIAARYGEGAEKYSDNNWCLGIPRNVILNHVLNHLFHYMRRGNVVEDELAAVAWGIMALMHYESKCEHHKRHEERDKYEVETESQEQSKRSRSSLLIQG